MGKALLIATALFIVAVRPAQAESWRHPHLAITVPDTLDGLPRGEIRDVEKNGLDVALNFEDAAGGEYLTIYIFRNVAGDVPVWFDRAITMMKVRPEFAAVEPAAAPAGFAPPGQSRASALRQFFSAPSGPFKSTGIVLMPMGEWYVKLRLTSKSLTAEQLSARLDKSLAAISWPGKQAEAPAAVLVAACATPLGYAADAKPVKGNLATALMGAMLGGIASQIPEDGKAETQGDAAAPAPVTWCRDGKVVTLSNQLPIAAVYQRNAETDAYLLALGDSGRALMLAPKFSIATADTKRKRDKPGWTPAMLTLDRSVIFQDFNGLATPEQMFALLENGKVVSTVSTFGANKGNMTLNSDK